MFTLGKVRGTIAALRVLQVAGMSPATLLIWHQQGDYGEINCVD